jgi:hypothetical protein
MITVFTLCSANYLAHAKTLGDSLAEHNPDFHFVIGLVDRLPEKIAPSFWHPYELIPVEDLDIPGFWEMARQYDLVELNMSVKPSYMEYLYRRDPSARAVIYLDPDILVCSSFKALIDKLQTYNVIVTPHSCTFDNSPTNKYYEGGMLTTGIYNLGFLATSRSEITFAFLDWWQNRLRDHCYFRQGEGGFGDQLWMNLAPLYFSGVHVEKNPGYNMCYWNHFERSLTRQGGRHLVNGKYDLIFYHFSSYSPARPDAVTARVKSVTMSFSERPDLRPIYDDYRVRLLSAGYDLVRSLPYAIPRRAPGSDLTLKDATKETIRLILRLLPTSLQTLLQRLAQLTANSLK